MSGQETADWVEVSFQVPGDRSGLRVDAYLAGRLHRYSRAQVQRLIVGGRVFLRGRAVKPSARIAKDDRIVVRYPRREEPPPRHAALPILYEDDDVLAVNKPGDVLSHPTDKILLNSATSILRNQFGRPLHLAHRLDRETSGVLLFAKNAAAAKGLTESFTHRKVRKEYLAIVAGRVRFARKTVDAALGREGLEIKVRQAVMAGQPAMTEHNAQEMAASTAVGKATVTEFERLAFGKEYSLVRALPRTGRLHQIRVHLAWLGHPVVGDKLYSGAGEIYLKACLHRLTPQDLFALGAERQMLHARRLEVPHPASGRTLVVAAPPPQDFMDCLKRLLPAKNFYRPGQISL